MTWWHNAGGSKSTTDTRVASSHWSRAGSVWRGKGCWGRKGETGARENRKTEQKGQRSNHPLDLACLTASAGAPINPTTAAATATRSCWSTSTCATMRMQAQGFNCLEGFQLCHYLGGGLHRCDIRGGNRLTWPVIHLVKFQIQDVLKLTHCARVRHSRNCGGTLDVEFADSTEVSVQRIRTPQRVGVRSWRRLQRPGPCSRRRWVVLSPSVSLSPSRLVSSAPCGVRVRRLARGHG